MDKLMFVLHMVGMALAIGSGFSVISLKMGSADMNKAEREPYMLGPSSNRVGSLA